MLPRFSKLVLTQKLPSVSWAVSSRKRSLGFRLRVTSFCGEGPFGLSTPRLVWGLEHVWLLFLNDWRGLGGRGFGSRAIGLLSLLKGSRWFSHFRLLILRLRFELGLWLTVLRVFEWYWSLFIGLFFNNKWVLLFNNNFSRLCFLFLFDFTWVFYPYTRLIWLI